MQRNRPPSSSRRGGSPNGLSSARPVAQKRHVIGISEAVVYRGDCVLITHALGSCIAVCLFDRDRRISGLLHFLLPDSKTSPDQAKKNPYMFGDTGIVYLIDRMVRAGASRSAIRAKVVGGASVLGIPIKIKIGKRNFMTAKKVLWAQRIAIEAQEVGGSISRTVALSCPSGTVKISTPSIAPRTL